MIVNILMYFFMFKVNLFLTSSPISAIISAKGFSTVVSLSCLSKLMDSISGPSAVGVSVVVGVAIVVGLGVAVVAS